MVVRGWLLLVVKSVTESSHPFDQFRTSFADLLQVRYSSILSQYELYRIRVISQPNHFEGDSVRSRAVFKTRARRRRPCSDPVPAIPAVLTLPAASTFPVVPAIQASTLGARARRVSTMTCWLSVVASTARASLATPPAAACRYCCASKMISPRTPRRLQPS